MKIVIKQLIRYDKEVIEDVKCIIKEYEKDEWSLAVKRFCSVVGAILLAIVTSLVTYWFTK